MLLAGRHWRSGWRNPRGIPRDTLARLNEICAETGALVVLSGSQRLDDDARQRLTHAGFAGAFHRDWHTGFVAGGRGRQIAYWLRQHPDAEVFAIVDDEGGMLPEHEAHLVRTQFDDGLDDLAAARLKGILRCGAPLAIVA